MFASSIRIERLILPIAIAALLTIASFLIPNKASAADFTWTYGADTTQDQFTHVDLNPGIARDAQGNLWVIYTDGSLIIHRLKGTTIDDLIELPNGTRDTSFNRPHGDDNYWLNGLWIDPADGKWYATVHMEFNYNPNWPSGRWTRGIGLATSTDEGLNWHYEGDIVTSDNPTKRDEFAGDYWDWGVGDQSLYVDAAGGYFYLFYGAGWQSKSEWRDYLSTRVARCEISSKMMPGCWQKWHNGSWSEPGLGGHDTDLFNNSGINAVFYSTYLNKFVAVGQTMIPGRHDGTFATATDLSTQNWTVPEKFIDADRLYWYNWAVDPTTSDRMQIGQNFRLYSAQNFYENKSGKYINVSLGPGTTVPITFPGSYPEVSVPDYSPLWDWTPAGAYRQDFSNNGIGGWQKIYGTADWTVEAKQLKSTTQDGGATLAVDNASPSISDGYMSFTVKPVSNQRFKAVFRYQDWNRFAAILYDNGNIGWDNGTSVGSLFSIPPFADNSVHLIDIYFKGDFITVYIDHEQKYSGKIPSFPTEAGKIGFSTWYYSTIMFDNVVVSASLPVSPHPLPPYIASYSNDFGGGIAGYQERFGSGGTWAVENGELSGTAGAGTTVAIDSNSPRIKNATIKAKVKPISGQRFGIVARFNQNATAVSYNAITYENGNIGYDTSSATGTLVSGINLADGSWHDLEITLNGLFVVIKVDGVIRYSGEVAAFRMGEGNIGFMTSNNAHVHFDEVSYRMSEVYHFQKGINDFRNAAGNGTWLHENGMLSGQSNAGEWTTNLNETMGDVADGKLSFSVTPIAETRFIALLRYTGDTQLGLMYNDGEYLLYAYQNGQSTMQSLFNGPVLPLGTNHDIDIAFSGQNLKIAIDGVEKYSGAPNIPTTAGKIGFSLWANSHVHFDNVVVARD